MVIGVITPISLNKCLNHCVSFVASTRVWHQAFVDDWATYVWDLLIQNTQEKNKDNSRYYAFNIQPNQYQNNMMAWLIPLVDSELQNLR
jgi:hypothetical protein